MRRVNKKLVEALDKLIAKYSQNYKSYHDCPLCSLFAYDNCKNCPNMFFNDRGCNDRRKIYSETDWFELKNYPILKQFWTDYKSLYLQRIYTNSEIMEILIKPFKEERNEK